MKRISLDELKELANSILFENNINELRLPTDHDMDAGKNMRHSMYDRPGPIINDDDVDDIFELPIAPSEIMPGGSNYIEKIDTASIESKNYYPANSNELIRATNTLLHNYKEDITQKHIEKVWHAVSNIIKKVNKNEK